MAQFTKLLLESSNGKKWPEKKQWVRPEADAAATMQITVFWDVTPYNLIDTTNVSEKITASIFMLTR
jgi:hypothetical protein